MKQKPFLICFVIICAALGSPAETCRYSSIEIDTGGSKMPLPVQSYRGVLKSVDELLCLYEKPQGLKLSLQTKGTDARYSFSGNEIASVALYEKYQSGKTAHPIYGQFILAHEYTHSIFTLNMMKASAAWGHWPNAELKANKLQNILNDLQDKAAQTTDPGQQALLKKQYAAVEKALRQVLYSLESINYVAAKAINEFYADLIPVVLTANPRAIYQALKVDHKDNFSDSSLVRDFSQTYGQQILSRWSLQVGKMMKNNELTGLRYTGLAPLRSFVWELIKGPVQNPANKSKIAIAIFQVLAQDYQSRFAQPMAAESLDVTNWNLQLAEKIHKKLLEK